MPTQPILYSFRRCPFAIRARMALGAAGTIVEHREISLRAKPAAMLAATPKGTVPVLVLPDGRVIDESIDIMRWALDNCDPLAWLNGEALSMTLITNHDSVFKLHLDRAKYADRFPGADPEYHRSQAMAWLAGIEVRLAQSAFLCGEAARLADVAIFPFVRQFARADPGAWRATGFAKLNQWLDGWCASELFAVAMARHEDWVDPAALSVAA